MYNVILHEMGHVIGIGTLWYRLGLVERAGSSDPVYVGEGGRREYGVLLGTNVPTDVPVANTGGQGTADSHWRETTFGNELMSGYADRGPLPLSRLTIAMLEDMRYAVEYGAADDYVLPSARLIALLGCARPTARDRYVLRPTFEFVDE